MPTLRLTTEEYRWLHDSLRATLASRRVLEDPEIVPAVNIFTKLSKGISGVFCKDCHRPEVYAKGQCQACWKRERRKVS